MTNHELQGEDMGPFENMSEGFTGRLQDEIGKQTDRGTCQNFISIIGGHRHRLRIFSIDTIVEITIKKN